MKDLFGLEDSSLSLLCNLFLKLFDLGLYFVHTEGLLMTSLRALRENFLFLAKRKDKNTQKAQRNE